MMNEEEKKKEKPTIRDETRLRRLVQLYRDSVRGIKKEGFFWKKCMKKTKNYSNTFNDTASKSINY